MAWRTDRQTDRRARKSDTWRRIEEGKGKKEKEGEGGEREGGGVLGREGEVQDEKGVK